MKHFKKFFSYLVALTMVLSLAAFTGVKVHAADTTYTLNLKNTGKTEHTFEVYQIFKGDLSTNTEGKQVLSNVKWGDGVKEDGKKALGDADKKAEALASSKNQDADAKAFAEDLQNYLQNGTERTVAAGSTEPVSGLKAGYYLVKDKVVKDKVDDKGKSTQDGKKEGATTLYILQVVQNITATSKLDVPTVVKKVQDKNDSTGDTSDWHDSADYDIGDWVPYQITGTMPSRINDYKTYSYKFTDTMSKGLTFDEDNTENNYKATHKAKITLDGIDVTRSFEEKITHNTDGTTTVEWSCSNLKGINKNADDTSENAEKLPVTENSKVIVTYEAQLNENAEIGSKGNPNTVYLTYSNNPNKGGEGETGKTPDDKNIVFTYKTVVNKFDQDGKTRLKGAGFTLKKKVKNEEDKVVKTFTAGEETTFEFTGLDDGDYELSETTTPAGYNTITPIEFTISAEHEKESDEPRLISLNGFETTGEVTLSGNQKVTVNKDAGSLTADVINKKGSTLPSTGGMGTTLLYVAGGILVACAAAYVVMSRKHSTNK